MAALVVCTYAIAMDAKRSCAVVEERKQCIKRSARLYSFILVTYGLFAVGIYMVVAAVTSDNYGGGTWGWVLTSVSGLFVIPLEVVVWSVLFAYACRCDNMKQSLLVHRLANIVAGPGAVPDTPEVPPPVTPADTPIVTPNMSSQGLMNVAYEPPSYDSAVAVELSYLPPKYEDAVKADGQEVDNTHI